MLEPLPCPQSATEVHWSTFTTLAIATGTLYFLRRNNPISQPNLQFRRAQCCDFCSKFCISSCGDVANMEVACASPRAL